MKPRTRYAALAAWLLVSSVLAGCEDGRTRPPSVTVRVVHAAPERSTLDFLREQRTEAQLDYRQASGQLVFDSDEYDFNVRALDPGGQTTTLIGNFSHTLVPENTYLFVITEAAGELVPIVIEKEPYDGDSSEINAVHSAPSLGPMSLYLLPPGTPPAVGTEIGTLAFGETLDSATVEPGDYRLTLTEAGNPANVLMSSGTFELEGRRSYAYAILDPADDSHAAFSVVFLGGETTQLFDRGLQSSMTVLNAAADGEPRDVYVDEDFSEPVLAAAPHLVRSDDIPVAFGSRDISVTPAGNPAAVEGENSGTFARARHHLVLIGGETGDLSIVSALDDRRRIIDQASVSFMNATVGYERLEFFLVPPDTDISDRLSSIVLDSPAMTPRVAFRPGDYELYVRELDGDVLAGPEPVSVSGKGLYSILATNGAVAGTVDVVYYEDFVD